MSSRRGKKKNSWVIAETNEEHNIQEDQPKEAPKIPETTEQIPETKEEKATPIRESCCLVLLKAIAWAVFVIYCILLVVDVDRLFMQNAILLIIGCLVTTAVTILVYTTECAE